MFKKLALLMTILMGASSAQAIMLQCEVDGYSDYSVEVNTKSGQAAFFDNDSWIVVPQVSNRLSGIVKFEGDDPSGTILTISIDLQERPGWRPQHSMTFQEDGRNRTPALTCSIASELLSGI